MKRSTRWGVVWAMGLVLTAWAPCPADGPQAREARQPLIQLAILLDNSGSMQGLIDQARSELWKVVNELVSARRNGLRPRLEVALYTYGTPPPVMRVALTEDLDKVSEELFKVQINGGDEYCGMVIQQATRELNWSTWPEDLKLIFIAGNEPFSQGPVPYQDACKEAIVKGIVVNTIHCGGPAPKDWRQGATLADGRSMSIDHNQAVAQIDAPQDKRLAELGLELNRTYVAFGPAGPAGAARQEAQDQNSIKLSPSNIAQRAVSKASAYYQNSAWDLCDACTSGKVDIAKVPEDQLPEFMRKMTVKERKDYVDAQVGRRKELQAQVNKLNEERKTFVAQALKDKAQHSAATLDRALIDATRQQAVQKNFAFE